jgi:hypothetical protein
MYSVLRKEGQNISSSEDQMDQIVDIKLESSGLKNDFSSMIKKDSSMSVLSKNENSNVEHKPMSFVNFE